MEREVRTGAEALSGVGLKPRDAMKHLSVYVDVSLPAHGLDDVDDDVDRAPALLPGEMEVVRTDAATTAPLGMDSTFSRATGKRTPGAVTSPAEISASKKLIGGLPRKDAV